MHRLARVGAGAAAALAALLLSVAATGGLYLLRPDAVGLPGPAVRDALPLDELPGHAGAPLLLYLPVWLGAGALLALVLRRLRFGRLGAALLAALCVAVWLLLADGASIVAVRQIAYGEGARAAVRLPAVVLAAVSTGTVAALLGRPRGAGGGGEGGAVLLALLTAAAGAVDLFSAFAARHDAADGLVGPLLPTPASPLAQALIVPAGLALLLAARGLAARKRRALVLAVSLLAVSTLLHLLRGLDLAEAAATGAMAVLLLAARDRFPARGDPRARPRVALLALVLAGLVYGYGLLALWSNRAVADRPFGLLFGLEETTRALAARSLGGSAHLSGSVGEWFPLSVFLLAVVATLAVVRELLAPWGYRLRQTQDERLRARHVVREWGADTLAPFTLRGDKSYFFSADGSAFLAYRVLAGVAVVSGDPIGPPGSRAGLLAGFLEHAHERGWRVAVLGVSQRSLDLHRGLGLHAVYHGDEAVVDPARFTLEGRAMRKVRQSTHRLSRAGYRFDVVSAAEAPPELRAELAAVAARRGSGRGFAMALAELFDADGPEAVFALGRAPNGRVGGFLHLAVCAPAAALTLSSMPRCDGTPNGFNEWLVCETIAWARANGFALVSLNFAPLAQVFARARDGCSLARAERALLCAVKPALGLQLDDLGRFGRKFLPEPERRFVVFERWGDLPRAGVACLAAEGYLPLARAGR